MGSADSPGVTAQINSLLFLPTTEEFLEPAPLPCGAIRALQGRELRAASATRRRSCSCPGRGLPSIINSETCIPGKARRTWTRDGPRQGFPSAPNKKLQLGRSRGWAARNSGAQSSRFSLGFNSGAGGLWISLQTHLGAVGTRLRRVPACQARPRGSCGPAQKKGGFYPCSTAKFHRFCVNVRLAQGGAAAALLGGGLALPGAPAGAGGGTGAALGHPALGLGPWGHGAPSPGLGDTEHPARSGTVSGSPGGPGAGGPFFPPLHAL